MANLLNEKELKNISKKEKKDDPFLNESIDSIAGGKPSSQAPTSAPQPKTQPLKPIDLYEGGEDRCVSFRVSRELYNEYSKIVKSKGLKPVSVIVLFVKFVVRSDGEILNKFLDYIARNT